MAKKPRLAAACGHRQDEQCSMHSTLICLPAQLGRDEHFTIVSNRHEESPENRVTPCHLHVYMGGLSLYTMRTVSVTNNQHVV